MSENSLLKKEIKELNEKVESLYYNKYKFI